MKYGVLIYQYKRDGYDENSYNIGDAIQSFAVLSFYKSMGIAEKDIVYISVDQLGTYKGEYAIVVMNMYGGLLTGSISDNIIPIFWGFNYAGYISPQLKSLLKDNEPVGCRDEITLNNVRSAGVKAFLSGCVTLTLEDRSLGEIGTKTFLVDTPDELNPFIKNMEIERVSHIIESTLPLSEEEAIESIVYAEKLLNRYKKEASLVVTGRLHCASPCIAMGIPVVIVKKNHDINMSWIDSIQPIYVEQEFGHIDWDPPLACTKDLKDLMRGSLRSLIEHKQKQLTPSYNLSWMFENRKKTPYNQLLRDKLQLVMSKIGKTDFRYAIWGLGDGGNIAYHLICEECPDSRCVMCIDKYKTGEFNGMTIERPDALLKNSDIDYVFITTYAGRKEAVDLLRQKGCHERDDFTFMISRVNGEDDYFRLGF